MFVPTVSLLELFLRGTIIYLFLFGVLRILRREAGSVGISDLLLVVLISDIVQNAIAAEYKSITEGIFLILTIAFWDYFIDWLGYNSIICSKLIRPAALPLVKHGRVIKKNLHQEMITMEELLSQLRQNGVQDIAGVKYCYLEGDGKFSVIKKKE